MSQQDSLPLTATIALKNKKGLHTRPATRIAEIARNFDCQIVIEHNHTSANAHSVMDLMMLGAAYGTTLTLKAQGKEAKRALETLTEFINKMPEDPDET